MKHGERAEVIQTKLEAPEVLLGQAFRPPNGTNSRPAGSLHVFRARGRVVLVSHLDGRAIFD